MSYEDFLKRIQESIERMGLTADPEMDKLADEYAARMERGRKSVPLESKNKDSKEPKD
jgi:hypothetical protein